MGMPANEKNMDSMLESSLKSNTAAIAELQKLYLQNYGSVYDKLLKGIQVIVPLAVVWFAYYVNSQLSPIRKDVDLNTAMLKEEKNERKILEARIHSMDINQAKTEQILLQIQRDLIEVKDLIKSSGGTQTK